MKKFTKKLSMKYVKLHKCRHRQDAAMTSEEDAGELIRGIVTPESERARETIDKTPKVTKIMESMQRKFMSKDKVRQEELSDHLGVDNMEGRDQTRPSDGPSRKGGHGLADWLEESIGNGAQDRPRDEMARKDCDHVDKTKGLSKSRSDFGSRKEYLDWIEYVEGSSLHCFDRSEDSTRTRGFKEHNKDMMRKDGIEHDQISIVQSEGSIDGNNNNNNDEVLLLKSSKNKNHEAEASKGYKKGKNHKFDDPLLRKQLIEE